MILTTLNLSPVLAPGFWMLLGLLLVTAAAILVGGWKWRAESICGAARTSPRGIGTSTSRVYVRPEQTSLELALRTA